MAIAFEQELEQNKENFKLKLSTEHDQLQQNTMICGGIIIIAV